jgi:hypothetical protein
MYKLLFASMMALGSLAQATPMLSKTSVAQAEPGIPRYNCDLSEEGVVVVTRAFNGIQTIESRSIKLVGEIRKLVDDTQNKAIPVGDFPPAVRSVNYTAYPSPWSNDKAPIRLGAVVEFSGLFVSENRSPGVETLKILLDVVCR